jgi:hypothetical protein
MLHYQFEAMLGHISWTAREKAMHLLAFLQGNAAGFLHDVPAGAALTLRYLRAITGANSSQQCTLPD